MTLQEIGIGLIVLVVAFAGFVLMVAGGVMIGERKFGANGINLGAIGGGLAFLLVLGLTLMVVSKF